MIHISSTFNPLVNLLKYTKKSTNNKIPIAILISIISAALEAVTIGGILPLLTILFNFESNQIPSNYNIIGKLFLNLSFDINNFFIFLFLLVFISACFLRIYSNWYFLKLAAKISNEISEKLINVVLFQNYIKSKQIQSPQLINDLTTNMLFVNSCYRISLQLLYSILISLTIIISSLLISPKIYLSIILPLLSFYFIFGILIKKVLRRYSSLTENLAAQQLLNIKEILGTLPEIILNKSQLLMSQKYKRIDYDFRNYRAISSTLNVIPRYFLEYFSLIVILLSFYLGGRVDSDYTKLLPTYIAILVGFQKVIPLLQGVFLGWGNINSFRSSIIKVNQFLENNKYKSPILKDIKFEALEIQESFKLEGVSFNHPVSKSKIFQDLSLTFKKGEITAIVGSSGSGKSTLINIIMGLYIPQKGKLILDNSGSSVFLDEKILNSWQLSISYVPQEPFLFNNSIKNNITRNEENFNLKKLKFASEIACLDEFVLQKEEQYDFIIGEDGSNLSGGQKQRIALARSIYANNEILILDEATNALDANTENKIIENLRKKLKNKTILIITHRKNNLKFCDSIINLETYSSK